MTTTKTWKVVHVTVGGHLVWGRMVCLCLLVSSSCNHVSLFYFASISHSACLSISLSLSMCLCSFLLLPNSFPLPLLFRQFLPLSLSPISVPFSASVSVSLTLFPRLCFCFFLSDSLSLPFLYLYVFGIGRKWHHLACTIS